MLSFVALVHAGILLTMIHHRMEADVMVLPQALVISLIEYREEHPKPEVKPELPKPLPPKPVFMSQPAPPLLNVDKLIQQEPPRAIQAAETKPVVESVPEVLSPTAPAVVAEAPKPAPPPPVIEPRFDADYLDNPKPPYPRLSSKLGEAGRVFLRVLVKADGTVRELDLHKSSGYERLDSSALNTVRNWRFVPARQGSRPVDGWVIVPINFTFGS